MTPKTQKYIEDIKKIHGDRYDLSLIQDILNDKQKVPMICSKHGRFAVSINKIKSKRSGCPKCGIEMRSRNKSLNKGASIIDEFKKAHGDRYDYSKVVYRGDKVKVKIVCPVHGEFEQSPSNHKQGFGCRLCGIKTRDTLRSANIADAMIETFRMIHGDRYDYSKAIYAGTKTKMTIICPVHGEFEQTYESHSYGKGCRKCGAKGARYQKIVTEMLDELGVAYEEGNCSILFNSETNRYREIDIFIPAYNLGIELHGLVYHSEIVKSGFSLMNLHQWKFKESLKKGITLLQFFEDEVHNSPECIKSMIAHKLGISESRLYARKCKLMKAETKHKAAVKKFFEERHLQGSGGAAETYILLHEDEIVAAMNFNGITSERGVAADGKRWELTRFASKNVVGAASKLLLAFLCDHPEVEYLCSYSDNRISSGGVYDALGFEIEKEVVPQYSYIHNDFFTVVNKVKVHKRLHKSTLRKERQAQILEAYDPALSEHENALNHGFYRIYDAGKIKWSINLK